jgi:hypothetical protein
LRQPLGATALFPFSDLDSREHFEGHFEESVPVFAPAACADPVARNIAAIRLM